VDTPTQHTRFVALLNQHKGLVYKVARMYVPDPEESKDLVQEIVLQLWRAFPSYDEQYTLSTWMYRIALNVAISYFRKEKKHRNHRFSSEEVLLQMPAEATGSQRAGPDVELLDLFMARISSLDKALLILYLEGNPYQEIASVLGISETNVATKLSRLKDKLKHFVQQMETT
jgi:RNA polymerase sigma-70 factor (ECF subfamily)